MILFLLKISHPTVCSHVCMHICVHIAMYVSCIYMYMHAHYIICMYTSTCTFLSVILTFVDCSKLVIKLPRSLSVFYSINIIYTYVHKVITLIESKYVSRKNQSCIIISSSDSSLEDSKTG